MREARASLSWRDVRLVGVAREVGDERKRLLAPYQQASAVRFFRHENILKQRPIVLGEVRRLRLGLELDGLEYEVGRVHLTVRMRIAHTVDFALILEYQHVTYSL